MSKERILLGAIAVVVCAGAGVCFSATITVNWDGSADYTTIQDAIDDANDFDVVIVADGTYTGDGNRDIIIEKAITVRSENGAESCIIDCQGTETLPHRGFKFVSGEGADAVLEGFSITNGYGPVEHPLYSYDSMGGAIFCDESSPTITNCILNENSCSGHGGGLCCYESNTIVTECQFSNNSAWRGGGVYCGYSDAKISGSTFRGNEAENNGGGAYCSSSESTIMSCIFSDNSTGNYGGGVYCASSYIEIINCTLSSNTADSKGGGIYFGYHHNYIPEIINCIIWGNSPEQIYLYYSTPRVTYCDIQGGWSGVGNINVDPKFIDKVDGDYHLRWGSPCVDAGDPNFVSEEGEVDIDGEPRVMGGRVDMGADEVGEKQADFTRDGRIDIADLSVLGGSWGTQEGELNWYVLSDLFEDGVIDLFDVAMFAEDWLWVADWYP